MQTRENRIYRHFRSTKRLAAEYGMGAVWMRLARTWKMPVQEVKRIVREEKEQRLSS